MRAFKFRLQTVLEMREREEEVAARELAEAMRILEAEKTKLHELRMLEADALAEYHRMQGEGRLDLQAIQWFQAYSMRLASSIREQAQVVEAADHEAEKRRAALMQAAQAKQVLQKLKEQAKADHQKAMDAEEAKQLDEIATQRYQRRD